jgi:hypothetical protein
MPTILLPTAPEAGRIWLPSRSISLPGSPSLQRKRDVFVTVQLRPRWAQKGLIKLPDILDPGPNPRQAIEELLNPFKGDIDPADLRSDPIWMDVSHNERVDKGGEINITRLFGAVSGASTAAGVLTALAVASASLTVAHGDLSLGSGSANVTTNEFTTIGLSRAAATVQNFVGTTVLDATVSVDLYKSFSVTGSGTAYGAGLFDSTTVSGSFLFVEKNFSNGSATVANGDTLQVTITITL